VNLLSGLCSDCSVLVMEWSLSLFLFFLNFPIFVNLCGTAEIDFDVVSSTN
jgi:hypothetical protein